MGLEQELKQLNKALNNKTVEKTDNINNAENKNKKAIQPRSPQQKSGQAGQVKKQKGKKTININSLLKNIENPIWISVSEAAKLGGVQAKTIRRAIQSKAVKYKVVGNRYSIDITSIIIYLNSKTKLKNKFENFGLGQYVEKWQE